MFKFFWAPETASLAPMAVLEEVGAEYEAILIDYEGRQQKSADYLALNPCGLIPAMTLPDGRTMFEAAAIVMHLCDLYPAAHLAPPPGDPDRPLFYQWMLYLADSPQPTYRRYYYPDRFAADEDDVRKRGVDTLLDEFAIVEGALSHSEWLLGNRFSACDIYLHMLTTWFEPPEALYARFPNIARVAAGVEDRPASARAIARHRP
ncbi:MAG: glutathione S-transferase family protein [Alphaproteobacteria bacterium]|nr:glutathione S-transferase family protein [Alphaproteobacteria bacterium]